MKQQEQQSTRPRPDFVHNEAQSRYELRLDGRLVGQAQYRREGGRIVFTHTEVDRSLEGQGLGSRLAGLALDDVKMRGLQAVPQCSFIARFIQRNEKEYGALVA